MISKHPVQKSYVRKLRTEMQKKKKLIRSSVKSFDPLFN